MKIDREEQRRLANVAVEASLNELGWDEASHDEVQAFLTGYRSAYLALASEPFLLYGVQISEERWDAERQKMLYRVRHQGIFTATKEPHA